MKDTVIPESKWSFDENVSSCFDDMLKRSIPQYDVMRSTVASIAVTFIHGYSTVIDIGSSRGETIRTIIEMIGANNFAQFIGIECSKPMILESQKSLSSKTNVKIVEHDLRKSILNIIPKNNSVITSILSIQFVPIEYRQCIIQEIYDHLEIGGCFIFVEKVLGANAIIDKLMVNQYLNLKSSNGYTDEQIARKKLSLEGVLVPVTAKWNEELLHQAGFKTIDTFWRWMNFSGWVAIK